MTGPTTFKGRVYRSTHWVLAKTLVLNALLLAQVAILARLLLPRDFGEVSVVLVVMTLTDAFSQTGIDASIVRSRGRIDALLHAAWSVQVVRGVLLAGFVALVAVPVAHFQGSERLAGLLMTAATIPALEGFRSMSAVIYTRNLAQGRLAASEICVGVIAGVTAVLLAVFLRSPWAIVINLFIFTALKTVATYVIHPHRPRWTVRWGPLRPFLRFGVLFNLGNGLGYLAESLDKLLIGRLLGLHLLGLYDRAFLVSNFAVQQFPRFLAAVIFPGFASIAEDKSRFEALSRRYFRLLCAGFFVGGSVMFALAEFVVRYGLGPRFLEVTPLLRVLVIYAICRGIAMGVQPLFDAVGRPQYRLYNNTLHLAVLLAALPIGIGVAGLFGACVAVALSGFSGLCLTLVVLRRGAADPAGISGQRLAGVPQSG